MLFNRTVQRAWAAGHCICETPCSYGFGGRKLARPVVQAANSRGQFEQKASGALDPKAPERPDSSKPSQKQTDELRQADKYTSTGAPVEVLAAGVNFLIVFFVAFFLPSLLPKEVQASIGFPTIVGGAAAIAAMVTYLTSRGGVEHPSNK